MRAVEHLTVSAHEVPLLPVEANVGHGLPVG